MAVPEVMFSHNVPSIEICGFEMENPIPEIANVSLLVLLLPVTVMLVAVLAIVPVVFNVKIFPAADCVTATSTLVAPSAATVFVEEREERPVCALPAVVKVSLPVPLVLLTVFHAAFAIILIF
jgi:hypothetical protein